MNSSGNDEVVFHTERLGEALADLASDVRATVGAGNAVGEIDQAQTALQNVRAAADSAADPSDFDALARSLARIEEMLMASSPSLGGWQQSLDRAREALAALRELES